MSLNIELWNKCQKCKYIIRELYLTNDKEMGYIRKCRYNYPIGEFKCGKYEEQK